MKKRKQHGISAAGWFYNTSFVHIPNPPKEEPKPEEPNFSSVVADPKTPKGEE